MRFSGRTIVVVLAGVLLLTAVAIKSAVNAHEQQERARTAHKMKTVCVGRFLIDLPAETELKLHHAAIQNFDIEVYAESTDAFGARLNAREAQLRATPDRLGGNGNLETVRDLRTEAGFYGKMFVHGREVTEGTAANGLEIEHYRYENVALEALVHANGLSIDIAANEYDPALLENLPKLVGKLIPGPENRIPLEPGYCIDRVLVREPLTPEDMEELTMFGTLASRPDVQFQLILAAGRKPDSQSLLERSDGPSLLAPADRWRIARLRAAPRSIAGVEGDELVRRFVEKRDVVVHNFTWEVNGKPDDVYVPHIMFMMDTGKSLNGSVQSSLSEGAALGLWDAVTSSIRFHHTSSAGEAKKARGLEGDYSR